MKRIILLLTIALLLLTAASAAAGAISFDLLVASQISLDVYDINARNDGALTG